MKQLVIGSLPQAYEVIKGMDLTVGWDSDYRQSARDALKDIPVGRMEDRIADHVEEMVRVIFFEEVHLYGGIKDKVLGFPGAFASPLINYLKVCAFSRLHPNRVPVFFL